MPGPMSAPNGNREVVSAPNPKEAAEKRYSLMLQGKLRTGKTEQKNK